MAGDPAWRGDGTDSAALAYGAEANAGQPRNAATCATALAASASRS